ncbi:MAG: CHAT domain-containing protein [Acidimicrobiales bacterium]
MSDLTAGLTAPEWRALVYFNRVDELGQSAPSTDIRAAVAQFEQCDDPTVRAAIACLVGSLHATAGSFAEAEHWFQISTGMAPESTWVAARAAAYHANHLLWNGDVGLARAVFAEVDPIDHPMSNFGVRIVRARIVHGEGDDDAAQAILDTVVPEECHDPLGIAEPVLAIFGANLALTQDRVAEAEVIIRRSLLRNPDGTRAHALLVDRLGQVMARCGLVRETDACRRMAQSELGRWPSEARGSNRGFERLLVALGLRAPSDGEDRRWPASAGATGRAIVERQAEVERHIECGDRAAARRSTAALVRALVEHTRPLESIEARSTAVRTLADPARVAIGLGRLGDPADALRVAMATMRIVVADQTRGEPAARAADALRDLAAWSSSLDPESLNHAELADLDQRISRLDGRRRTPGVALPVADWLDRPMPQRALVLFEETGGRLWRVTARGDDAAITDLGDCRDIERSVRAFRLAAAALGFDRPDGEQRLRIAAETLDRLLFTGCSWDDAEPLTMVPSTALSGLPWRLLPSMRRLHLGMAIGDPASVRTSDPRRGRVTTIRGPGLGNHTRTELDAIGRCYPESADADEPLLTPSRLNELIANTDVVHLACHGRLDRTQFRLHRLDRASSPAAVRPIPSDGPVADTVVCSSCDLTLNAELGRLGLAWQLIDNGVSHVVASTLDLDDNETAIVMPALHRLLAQGCDPLDALAALQFDDLRLQSAADSLLCVCVGPPH